MILANQANSISHYLNNIWNQDELFTYYSLTTVSWECLPMFVASKMCLLFFFLTDFVILRCFWVSLQRELDSTDALILN